MASLESEWNALLENSKAFGAALTWTWIHVWLKYFADQGEMWLLTAREEDTNQLVGIAPLFKTQYKPKYGSAYRQIEFIGASHWHENLDFIIQPGYEGQVIPMFIDKLFEHAKEWDVLLISSLDNPQTLEILQAARPGWVRNPDREMLSPYAELPATPDEWMQSLSKNRRWKLRRYCKSLEDEFGNDWAIKRITDENELDGVFDRLVDYHQAQWEAEGKPGAFHYREWTPYLRELMHEFNKNGWLRLNCLCIRNHPEVITFSYNYQNRIYSQISGVHQTFTEIPIGHIMTRYSIESAIREDMEKYMFMWGDESYKYSFGAVDRTLLAYELIRNPSIRLQRRLIHWLRATRGEIRKRMEK